MQGEGFVAHSRFNRALENIFSYHLREHSPAGFIEMDSISREHESEFFSNCIPALSQEESSQDSLFDNTKLDGQ